jgi:hypothetical protein
MGTSRKYLLNVGGIVAYGIGSADTYHQYSLLDSFTITREVITTTTTTAAPTTTTTTTAAPTTTTTVAVDYYVDDNDDIFTDYNGSAFI